MSFKFRRLIASFTLGAFVMSSSVAFAYNNSTHARIVNKGMDVVRLATIPGAVGQIPWAGGQPPVLVPFGGRGSCALPASDVNNLCGRTVSEQEWTDYTSALATARVALGNLRPEAPAVGDIIKSYFPNFDTAHETIFDNIVAGNDNSAGYFLGWHAQSRDDDAADLWVDTMWVIIGQILQVSSEIWDAGIGAILVPFVCLYDLFAGNSDCGKHAHRLANQINVFDVIKGILPGWKNEDASKERGLWHFINVKGGSNWYDDIEGMFYDEAGPIGMGPAAIDQSIMLAGDLIFLTLDASNSAGTERYEITSEETSFPHPSEDRADWSWQSETIGHTQFAPLDNFALFGNDLFVRNVQAGNFGASPLGWPLHAIGDATVPMHTVNTSGWGHRAYEDFVNHSYSALMFEEGDRYNHFAANSDLLMGQQLAQAQRILQIGFKWYDFIKSHPDTRDFITQLAGETLSRVLGEPPHGGVWCEPCSYGLLNRVDGVGADGQPCEGNSPSGIEGVLKKASLGYYTEIWDHEAACHPEAYYRNSPRLYELARSYLEQASGASIGYLVHQGLLASQFNLCVGPQQACVPGPGTTGMPNAGNCCAGGFTCGGTDASPGAPPVPNVCCKKGGEGIPCDTSDECCASSTSGNANACIGGRCCFGNSLPAIRCQSSDDCCGNVCDGGTCVGRNGAPCFKNENCLSLFCAPGGHCDDRPQGNGGGGPK